MGDSGKRGQYLSPLQRREILDIVHTGVEIGCSRKYICELLGISTRTVQRWEKDESLLDKRTVRVVEPTNKLSQQERDEVLKTLTSKEFCDLSPCQVVPILADRKTYLCSESTMFRILRANKMVSGPRRRSTNKPKPPRAHRANGPNQVWTWDITYLPGKVRGTFFYLYMIVDLYSRKVVGWEVHEEESGKHSSDLVTQACLAENIADEHSLVLHADNGGPMKGATMLFTLQRLGIMPSFSRPSHSNDNPFSESLFRTLKARPCYPEHCFETLAEAQAWVLDFVDWYNTQHRHSALKFVTPHQRHTGSDQQLRKRRHLLYQEARRKHPERWPGKTRNWSLDDTVHLNPSKEDQDAA